MFRFALALLLCTPALGALAATDTCQVAGTAYGVDGRPLRAAVVRLVDLQTRGTAFSALDAHSGFVFDRLASNDNGIYRLDVLSAPTTVTGSHIATRSVLGMSPTFACTAGQFAHEDVRVQID
jgi:hypothetical protein